MIAYLVPSLVKTVRKEATPRNQVRMLMTGVRLVAEAFSMATEACTKKTWRNGGDVGRKRADEILQNERQLRLRFLVAASLCSMVASKSDEDL